MNSVILCEGGTDAVLLGYYLIKVLGWEFSRKALEHLDIKTSETNQTINWYKRGNDRLLICGVGGKDNMFSFFADKIYSPMIKWDAFSKIVLILDRDDKSIEAIEAHASHLFKPIVIKRQLVLSGGIVSKFALTAK